MKMRFLLLFSILFCGKAFACSCAFTWKTESAFAYYDVVFSGRVIGSEKIEIRDSASNHSYSRMQFKFRIDEGYKGTGSDTTVFVNTGMHDGDCGYHFFPGIKYIVFASRSAKNNSLNTSICSATENFNSADAKKLQELAVKKESSLRTDSLQKSITVHFYYGSKPARGYKKTESHYFGGIHGGHVSLQIDSTVFSFVPAGMPVHIFAHRNKRQSTYISDQAASFLNDTDGCKFTSITFPISDSQYTVIQNLKTLYLDSTPYDYAFFGMRCAAAAYDVLGQAGVVKKRNNFTNVCRNFYPKRMRKRLIRRAKREQLQMVQHDGRKSRRWEKD